MLDQLVPLLLHLLHHLPIGLLLGHSLQLPGLLRRVHVTLGCPSFSEGDNALVFEGPFVMLFIELLEFLLLLCFTALVAELKVFGDIHVLIPALPLCAGSGRLI